jgi:CheY-like chemotaxis protein
LLVEDHMSLANATAFLMRHEGLEVWIAANGREALELADKVRPEIVLCDLRLPDMSGLDTARELRARPGAKGALIAIHTAMPEGSPETYRQHADEFVNLFLPKPLTVEKVDILTSELLALRRSVSRAAVHRPRH